MVNITDLLGLKTPIILASQSPRRRQLLQQLGLQFTVQPSSVVEEEVELPDHPEEYVQLLALHKAQDIAETTDTDALVIGADTIVVLEGRILNKPSDAREAYTMLRSLSGKTHTVYTGLALVHSGSGRLRTAFQRTDVSFRELGDEEIQAYIAGGSPMDKAGAYGIQDDFGAVFVQHIVGDYYNIVGLPLELLYRELKEFLRS